MSTTHTKTMSLRMRQGSAGLGLSLLLISGASFAQENTQLTPAKDRISDTAITADQAAFEQLQRRLHLLNESGIPVRNYHLAKAQCWLDVSLHEYTRNDRSAFPQEAMTESEKLIRGLENKVTGLSFETTLVNQAARLRPDLWDQAASLKKHPGFQCVQSQVACSEVELVHAGNEQNQQQWRHAKPYVQIAEDLIAQARHLADNCPVVAAAPVTPAAPVVLPLVAPVASSPVQLYAEVLFDFDRFAQQNIRPSSKSEVEWLVSRVRKEGLIVQSVALVGHADLLNHTGKANYNQVLSAKRAATVRDLLSSLGLAVSSVSVDARGDSQQVKACESVKGNSTAQEACLLPNRRVTVQLNGIKPISR